MERIVDEYNDNDSTRRNTGDCDVSKCVNDARFQIGTMCSCRLQVFSCFIHLQKAVMIMSDRDDSHASSETVTVKHL